MPKGDAFERKVKKVIHKDGMGYQYVSPANAAKLLRAQHRAMVRMVKKEFSKMEAITLDRTNSNGRIVMAHYKALQCRDILTQLNARANE